MLFLHEFIGQIRNALNPLRDKARTNQERTSFRTGVKNYTQLKPEEDANQKAIEMRRTASGQYNRGLLKAFDKDGAKTTGKWAGGGAAGGGAIGAGLGAMMADKGKRKRGALIGGMIGTGIGTALGTGTAVQRSGLKHSAQARGEYSGFKEKHDREQMRKEEEK